MATALFTSTTVSGSTYTLNVPLLELSSNLSVKDFVVTHNGVDFTPSYTKTSQTQLSYAGSTVTLGTLVRVVRQTPITAAETTFITTTTATELTNALTKLSLRIDELQNFISYQTGLLLAGGVSVGASPVNNAAYGVSWSGDATTAPSRGVTYNQFQQLLTGNNTISGNNTFTGLNDLGAPVATSPASTDDSTKVATTSSTRLMHRPIVSASMSGNQAFSVNNTKVNLDTTFINLDSAWNTSTQTFTAPRTGVYEFSVAMFINASNSTGIGSFQLQCSVQGDIRMLQASPMWGFFSYHSTMLVNLAANETVFLKFVNFGTGQTCTAEAGISRLSIVYVGK